jgi:hypothetical protein
MSDRVWYYASGGQQRGPVKTGELKRLAVADQLRPTDLVWTDNMANWAPAGTIKGLFPEPTATTAESAEGAANAASAPAEAVTPEIAEAQTQAASPAVNLVVLAPREAWAALRKLIVDPWGLLGTVYEQLGPKRGTIVGVAFVAAFFMCCVLAIVFQQAVLLPGVSVLAASEAISLVKALIVLIGYVAAFLGTVTAFRVLARTKTGMAADLFVAGAALVPLGVFAVIDGLLNPLSTVVQWIVSAAFIFAQVTAILMLYNGLKQPVRLGDRLSALAVPTVLVAAMTAAQVLQWLLAKLPF